MSFITASAASPAGISPASRFHSLKSLAAPPAAPPPTVAWALEAHGGVEHSEPVLDGAVADLDGEHVLPPAVRRDHIDIVLPMAAAGP